MSGHNKWSSIKNKKGKEDAKKGKIFTKHARNITVAAREGGPNPDYNPSLAQAIEKAKADNMPNDNIERAIKKATGEGATDNFERIIYEGYGAGGVAVIVDCLTDNKNRTAPDIRHFFDKFGGNLGTDGSVMFMFNRKGQIETNKAKDLDSAMEDAIEASCEDVEENEDSFTFSTSVEDFNQALESLKAAGYEVSSSDLEYVPDNYIDVDKDKQENLVKLIEALEDDDDVQNVYTNWNVPDDLE